MSFYVCTTTLTPDSVPNVLFQLYTVILAITALLASTKWRQLAGIHSSLLYCAAFMTYAYSDLTPLVLVDGRSPTTAQSIRLIIMFVLGVCIPLSMPGVPSAVSCYNLRGVMLSLMNPCTDTPRECFFMVKNHMGIL
jgi:hypothetical protein